MLLVLQKPGDAFLSRAHALGSGHFGGRVLEQGWRSSALVRPWGTGRAAVCPEGTQLLPQGPEQVPFHASPRPPRGVAPLAHAAPPRVSPVSAIGQGRRRGSCGPPGADAGRGVDTNGDSSVA